jgi:hypothetical protein
MIEAFACGTPVIAYRCGSVPEVMEDGVTGFIVDDQAGAIAAARAIGQVDRRACRRVFEERFTAATMARGYVEVYRSLLREQPARVDEAGLLAGPDALDLLVDGEAVEDVEAEAMTAAAGALARGATSRLLTTPIPGAGAASGGR